MIYVYMTHAFPHSYLIGQGTYPQNRGTTLPLILPSKVAHKYHIAWKGKPRVLERPASCCCFTLLWCSSTCLARFVWRRDRRVRGVLFRNNSAGVWPVTVWEVCLYENRKLDNRSWSDFPGLTLLVRKACFSIWTYLSASLFEAGWWRGTRVCWIPCFFMKWSISSDTNYGPLSDTISSGRP